MGLNHECLLGSLPGMNSKIDIDTRVAPDNTGIAVLPGSDTRPARPSSRADAVLARMSRHGAITFSAAERALGKASITTELHEQRWVESWPGVLVHHGRVGDPLTRASAALLRCGPSAVLCGPTAAAMHGCTAAASSIISVLIPYDQQRRSLPGLAVQQGWIHESDVIELDDLRVLALDVALSELLCTGPQRMALACVEQALHTAGRRGEQFRSLIGHRVARRRDRRGTRQATGLLELAWVSSPPESAERMSIQDSS